MLRFRVVFATRLFKTRRFVDCAMQPSLYHIDVQMVGYRAISTGPFVSDKEAEWNRGLTTSIEVMFLFLK